LARVAILVPVLNEEKSLVNLLTSLSGQTFANFKVYLQDNFSDDQSLQIMSDFATRDNRFEVFSSPIRLPWNENWLNLSGKVIKSEQFDFVSWLAGDDVWGDQCYLEKLVLELEQNKQYGAVCPKFQVTFPSGEIHKMISVNLESKFSVSRIWSLCRNWDNIHLVYGLYRYEVFIKLLDSKISKFTPYLGSDWWWAYQFLTTNRSMCSSSATYIKTIKNGDTLEIEDFTFGRVKIYLRSIRLCLAPEMTHLIKLIHVRKRFVLAFLVTIFFFTKSLIKIYVMHKMVLLRNLGRLAKVSHER